MKEALKKATESKWLKFLSLVILVLLIPKTYGWIQEKSYLFLEFVWKLSGRNIDELLNLDKFLFDTIMCIFWFIVYGTWYAIIVRNRKKSNTVLPKEKLSILTIFQCAIIMLGLNGLVGIYQNFVLNNNIPGLSESLNSFKETFAPSPSDAYIWRVLSVAILGPIIEEILFRGIHYHYAEKIRSGWFPVIVTGVYFGIWHEEPVQVIYAAVIGIVLGVIYRYTKSLWLLSGLHIFNNFMSTLPPGLDTPEVNNIMNTIYMWCLLPMFIFLFIIIKKTYKKEALQRLTLNKEATMEGHA